MNATTSYLRLQEVADLLRVTPQTIRRYRRDGLLPPPIRMGRKLLWPVQAVERALLARAAGKGGGDA
jgi:DNA-binding transcriptional MerR regulator